MASQSHDPSAPQPHAQLLLEVAIVLLLSSVAAVRDKPMTLIHPATTAHATTNTNPPAH